MHQEYDFQLPCGFYDELGQLHQYGRMRLATALDEMESLTSAQQQGNLNLLPALLLSRVITQLGPFAGVDGYMLQQLYAADVAYLSDLYLRLNSPENLQLQTVCPQCQVSYQVEVISR